MEHHASERSTERHKEAMLSEEERNPTFRPPSDFRKNVESGLRTALATGFAFLWIGKGPFNDELSFFTGVSAIVCFGNTVGRTVDRSLEITHGALVGCLCAVLARWLMDYGAVWGGLGFFVSVFLVLRSRRLTSLGKKFGCLAVTIFALAQNDVEFPGDWSEAVGTWLRTHVEGGVFAVAACLLPYPRLATRDGALRAQFMCRSLSAAVRACVADFIKGRDESSISRARLLCEQVRYNLGVVRQEMKWSRLELGLLCYGCCIGGMSSADALEELAQVIEQVLQGVRGMRQSMSSLQRSRAQASFANALAPSLREVAIAVDDVLEAIPRGRWLPRAAAVFDVHNSWLRQMEVYSVTSRVAHADDMDKKYLSNIDDPIDNTSDSITSHDGHGQNGHTHSLEARRKRRTRQEAVAYLAGAVPKMMSEYNTARKAILYGLDEQGRPLEERERVSSTTAAAALIGEVREVTAESQRENSSECDGKEQGAEDRTSSNSSTPDPRQGVSFGQLAALAKRDLTTNSQRSPSPTPPPPPKPEEISHRSGGGSHEGDREPRALLLDGCSKQDSCDSEEEDVPHHVLVMKEREKLGSAATMARGAFLFSLTGLCATLTQETSNLTCRRTKDPKGALQFFLKGLWTAIHPPPGLLTAIAATGRCSRHFFAAGFGCCINRRRRRKEGQSLGVRRALGVEEGGGGREVHGRQGSGTNNRGSGSGYGSKKFSGGSVTIPSRNSRLWALSKNDTFWSLKVALSLTICAIFSLWPALSEVFTPAVWVPLTTSFIMTDKRASAASTCLLRLVGTVLGAVYAILAAKLSSVSVDETYGWEGHLLLLPWIAIASFFRNSDSFAYAALVAAFTAVVMFTSASTVLGADGEAVSLARITNTVVAICIYLTIDTLLVPTRAKGLVREEIHAALDAALNEVCINGERLFGARVCPRLSRVHFLGASTKIPSDGPIGTGQDHFSRPETPPPSLHPDPSQAPQASTYPYPKDGGSLVSRRAEHEPDGHSGHSRPANASGTRKHRRREDKQSQVSFALAEAEESAAWGQVILNDGWNEEKHGQVRDAESKNQQQRVSGTWTSTSAGENVSPKEVGRRSDGGHARAAAVSEAGQDRQEGHLDLEAGRGGRLERRLSHTGGSSSSCLAKKPNDVFLQKLVESLALQKHYLPLAELEPQLWYTPFPASAYHGMVAAQEELLRALSLMTRSAVAVSEDRSQDWRAELGRLGTHLAALVQLLKAGLEDARDVFHGDGENRGGMGGWEVRKAHEIHLLELQAEAVRLDSNVNKDFVRFIQAFLERGAFPGLQLESILRINTAIFSVMGLQRALLTLGHAVATVLDRESFSYYYR